MAISNSDAVFDDHAYLQAVLGAVGDTVTIFGLDLALLDQNVAVVLAGHSHDVTPVTAQNLQQFVCSEDLEAFKVCFIAIVKGEADAIGRPLFLGNTAQGGSSGGVVCALAPIRDVSGVIVAVLCSSRVDHARQDQQAIIADKEAMLTAILATVPDAMVVIDEYGRITSFSAAAQKLFGWNEAEIMGRNISILMPQPYASAHDGYVQRYLQTGQKRIIGIGREVQGQRRDGSVFPMELSIGEARTDNHRAFTGFIRDLTAIRETEGQLHKVQSELIHASRLSAVGTLASALAHELNQPLTAIANYTSTGRDMVGDDSPQTQGMLREALDEAAKEAVRAGQIVRRLRDFVAKGELDPQIISLSKLMNDATALGLIGAREQGVTWSIHIDPGIEDVLADRVQIQQVMVNLIRNAIEAMDQSSTKNLVIRAVSHHRNQVKVSVSDTGHGLSDEVAAQLFQPFVSSKPQGMGLGLSICRTIIEAHGGKLSVGSNPEGGAVFRFTLTRVAKDGQNDD